ncbi:hypothetical protein ALC60_03251 [Trachymyrmex zeteki]|uniref:Uncharacterized protein n=1 Tax=Mycetomoellerius zeteki TaxID=64791 RepID=A0A151XBT6_9HYME|nr:hypothetical protein ALC60_03251 [Trachymyrmex zeteki]
MSWDQILDLPYDLAFPILLPVVAYYRDDATATRCRSLSNSCRFSSSSFVLTLWSTNCSSCAILPVYVQKQTIPKIYLPNRPSHRPHSPCPCDPRSSFQQAARPKFVLSKLLKIAVAGTAFFFTHYLLFVLALALFLLMSRTDFNQQDSSLNTHIRTNSVMQYRIHYCCSEKSRP